MKLYYLKGDIAYTEDRGCIHRLFCIDRDGADVLLGVYGFQTWVDVLVPERMSGSSDEDVLEVFEQVVRCVNGRLKEMSRGREVAHVENWLTHACVHPAGAVDPDSMHVHEMYPLIGFRRRPDRYVRLYLKSPMLMNVVHQMLEAPLAYTEMSTFGGERRPRQVRRWLSPHLAKIWFGVSEKDAARSLASNARHRFTVCNGRSLDARLKFDHAAHIRPCGWFEVLDELCVRTGGGTLSTVENEFVLEWERGLQFTELPDDIPSSYIRCMGFDIECIGAGGHFPRAAVDAIVTISACVYRVGELIITKGSDGLSVVGGSDSMERHVFQVGSVGAHPCGWSGEMVDDTASEVFANVQRGDVMRLHSCASERDLLLGFISLCARSKAHVYITYNGNYFDIPYVMRRCELCGLGDALSGALTRGTPKVRTVVSLPRNECTDETGAKALNGGLALVPDRLVCTTRLVETRAHGKQIRRNVYMPGKVNFDLMMWMLVNTKESDYKLGAVSTEYLKRSKMDLPYHLLPFRNENPEGRLEIARYCMVDTVLTCYIAQFKSSVLMYLSMACTQMVDIEKKFMSGQQYCLLSMMMRKMMYPDVSSLRPHPIAFPTSRGVEVEVVPDPNASDEEDEDGGAGEGGTAGGKYKGATVIEPIAGYYEDPISTLDFASLYPSIMMAHNLSYETKIEREDIPEGWIVGRKEQIDGLFAWPLKPGTTERAEADCYEMSTGHIFVHPKHCDGIVSAISRELVNTRKAIRATMRPTVDTETGETVGLDAGTWQVRENAQLTVKIAGNSVYGGTGAEQGVLPGARYIAETVTREGREMIDLTKQVVERYCMVDAQLQKASEHPDAPLLKVVYGDTDSVFILFPKGTDVWHAQVASERLSEVISAYFPHPVKLEFEKISRRSLFKQTKKRYVLNMYEGCDRETLQNPLAGKVKMRGMSAVRRDNFQFKRNLETTAIAMLMDLTVDPEDAKRQCMQFLHDELKRLSSGRVGLEELTFNYSLTKPLEDYGEVNHPKLNAARMINASNPGAPLQPGDRFHVLMGYRPGDSPGGHKAKLSIDTASFLRGDYMVYLKHYIDACRNEICSLMSIFFMQDHARDVARQRCIGGGSLTLAAALGSKLSKRIERFSSLVLKNSSTSTTLYQARVPREEGHGMRKAGAP
jgi:DNA polymerase elongation subunit (family B)